MIRLSSLIRFGNSENATWDYIPAAYWSTLELHIGIVCACLPAHRPLLKRWLPTVLQSSRANAFLSNSGLRRSRSVDSAPRHSQSHTDQIRAPSAAGDIIPLVRTDSGSEEDRKEASQTGTWFV